MILSQPFNPQQYEPSFKSQGGLPIASKLPVVVCDHEIKPNSTNTGGFLALTLMVIDGQHKGATGVTRFNLYHTNQQAVEIAHKQLSAFCHAMGYYQQVNEVGALHNLPFLVDVGPQGNGQYTEVKALYNIQGQEIGGAKNAAAPAAPSAPAWQPNPPQAPAWQPNPPQAPAWQPPAAPTAPAAYQPAAPTAPAAWQPPAAPTAPAASAAPPWAQR